MSSLLPSTIKRLDDEDLLQEEDISLLERRYYVFNISNLTVEYELWKDRWRSHSGDVPEQLADALLHYPKNFVPGIHSLIQIFLTVLVSSATAGRSFSALRKIKSYLRSTIGEERLSGLATLYIHSKIDMDLEKLLTSSRAKIAACSCECM